MMANNNSTGLAEPAGAATASCECTLDIGNGELLGDLILCSSQSTDWNKGNDAIGTSHWNDAAVLLLPGSGSGPGSGTGKQNVTELNFLSVVESARVPLHLVAGKPSVVETGNGKVLDWFRGLLFGSVTEEPAGGAECWWRDACLADSPTGVLVALKQQVSGPGTTMAMAMTKARVTELLFYASPSGRDTESTTPNTNQEESFTLRALPLSSDLLYHPKNNKELTPPPSPPIRKNNTETTTTPAKSSPQEIRAVYLPHLPPPQNTTTNDNNNEPPTRETIHTLHPRKRKTVSDTFDQATERRQKARRKGGEGVAAAAASNSTSNDAALPGLRERQRTASAASQSLQPLVQTRRPLSRSPSLGAQMGSTPLALGVGQGAGAGATKHSSSLSHHVTVVQDDDAATAAAAGAAGVQTEEARNRDLISRVVMAGMRLWGLSQSKMPRAPAAAAAAGVAASKSRSGLSSPALDAMSMEEQQQHQQHQQQHQQQNDEYKLIYHQVFRGICFAFRAHMSSSTLSARADLLRDVADRLLTLYCVDPLQSGLGGAAGVGGEEVTPGGRKAFGSVSRVEGQEEMSPFGVRRGGGAGGVVESGTPSLRRRGGDGAGAGLTGWAGK